MKQRLRLLKQRLSIIYMAIVFKHCVIITLKVNEESVDINSINVDPEKVIHFTSKWLKIQELNETN